MSKDTPEVGDIVQETIRRGKYIRYFVLEKLHGAKKDYYMLLLPTQVRDVNFTIGSLLVSEKQMAKLKYLGKSKMKFGEIFEVQDE